MTFDAERFDELLDSIELVFKQIERKNASKNPLKIAERERHLIQAYNDIIEVGKQVYSEKLDDIKYVRSKTVEIRDRTLHCLGILHSKAKVPTDLTKQIEDNFYNNNSDDNKHSTNDANKIEPSAERKHTNPESKKEPVDSVHSSSHPHSKDNNNKTDNKMEDIDFLGKISKLVKSEYAGEPEGLESFIEQIELVKLGTPANKTDLLFKYLKSRLTDKAKEAVPATVTTIDDLITTLRSKIKPENSDVVLGRLLALKADKTSLQTFQEKAEELSEKLRRAYISDGIPEAVARKMVVSKAVEMCKASARTDYVKTVIASAHFDEPKDVLAKFVVEVTSETKEKKEAQVLNFSSNRGRGGRGRGRGKYQNGSNGQNGNGQYQNRRNFNNNYNNNGQYRSNWHNNGRGRGRGRQQNNDNNQYVRIIQQPGNEQSPSAEGAAQTLQQLRQQ